MSCSIEGCNSKGSFNYNGKEVFPKGYCFKHYQKYRKYGDPLHVINVKGENRMKHPLYNTYCGMIGRCFNSNNPKYKNYGGRGIIVSPEWMGPKGFNTFCEDMGEKPEGKTLDRIDNNSNYSKENCKWSTAFEQGQNKRNNLKVIGVYLDKRSNKYKVSVFINRKQVHIGMFSNYEDAVLARKEAEKSLIHR